MRLRELVLLAFFLRDCESYYIRGADRNALRAISASRNWLYLMLPKNLYDRRRKEAERFAI